MQTFLTVIKILIFHFSLNNTYYIGIILFKFDVISFTQILKSIVILLSVQYLKL